MNTVTADMPSSGGGTLPSDNMLTSLFSKISNPETPAQPVTPESATPPVVETPTPSKETTTEAPVSTKKGLEALLEDTEPEAKEEEAKVEDAKEENDGPQEDGPAKYKWGELKKEAKEAKTLRMETEKLRLELAEARKLREADPLKKELESLKAEREALQKKVYAFDVENTPEFQNTIAKPTADIIRTATEIAERSGTERDIILAAIDEPDVKKQDALLAELTENLSEREKGRLFRLVDDWYQVRNKERNIRANAADAAREIREREEKEASQRKIDSSAAEMRATQEVLEKFKAVGKQFWPNDSEKILAEIAEAAGDDSFDEMPVENKAYAKIAGVALPKLHKELKAARTQIASLQKEIQAITKSSPASNGSARSGNGQEPDKRGYLEIAGIKGMFQR